MLPRLLFHVLMFSGCLGLLASILFVEEERPHKMILIAIACFLAAIAQAIRLHLPS